MKNVQYVKIKVWYFENFLFVYKSRTPMCVHKKAAQKIFLKMLHIFNSMNKLRRIVIKTLLVSVNEYNTYL